MPLSHGPATRFDGSSRQRSSVPTRALWFDRAAMQQPKGVKMAEDVRAEIVASVLEVVVHEGDQIGEGDTLVLLESMKMEIPVLAEVAGTISKVSVSVGDVIQAGDLIAVIS
jgi:biotin carboxyl carrier protein